MVVLRIEKNDRDTWVETKKQSTLYHRSAVGNTGAEFPNHSIKKGIQKVMLPMVDQGSNH